ncbi:MAG: 2-succinyl-5-enolpyruvyl-6-hydroxy-3-cyclohexene-1-carboxylic-acid synthase [Bacteroidota bacterium]
MLSQAIYDIPQLLHLLGLTDVIISPGSRSAPLTVAFSRHPGFKKYVVPDERSAAFIALGMSLQTKKPTVLVCTSGSAAYNYAPAVAEAFYQQVPMLVLTADRPPEWIDQWDGQTIRQQNIYGQHVLKSYQLPSTDTSDVAQWHLIRTVNEAAVLAMGQTQGPVHINVPLREQLYTDQKFEFSKNLKYWKVEKPPRVGKSEFNIPVSFKKILILPGQQQYDQSIADQLEKLAELVPVVCDAQCNYSHLKNVVRHHDLFLAGKASEELLPDLVITFGKSIISKNLKLLLRNVEKLQHWHISESDLTPDTFKSLSRVIKVDPLTVLKGLKLNNPNPSFLSAWKKLEVKTGSYLTSAFEKHHFGEFEAVKSVIDTLPKEVDIHVANSMAIRYVNFLGVKSNRQEIFVNRGTSGIDGSLSTAVGSSLASGNKTVLITGDLAFFYDRNGLWHNYPPDDLLVILLNNHGGGIFGMIPGPRSQPELKEYFITEQRLTAAKTADDYKMDYALVNSRETLENQLPLFSQRSGLRLLEIETATDSNQKIFDTIKSEVKTL